MRAAVRLVVAAAAVAGPLFAPLAPSDAAAGGHEIPLPPTFRNIDPLTSVNLGLRPDRLRKSTVPSSVDDTEAVTVGVGPTGVPAVVTDRQQLVVHGAGAYLIYELGPARAVQGLNDLSLPTAEVGQVVWQGFSPGSRSLDGLLTLDAGIESARLPMAVTLSFTGTDGHRGTLGPGGAAPADGVAHVTLTNATASPRYVAVGTADAKPLAQALDALLAAARSDRPGVPPYAGAGLPATIPGALAGQTQSTVVAPLRVTGTITVPGALDNPVSGGGTTQIAGGATVSGTLQASASFDVRLRAGQRLAMSLDVQPWLDPRTLTPPGGLRSWAAWAATNPDASARADATATLIAGAAAAARAGDYSPYLQTDTHGLDVATFRYEIAPESATRRAGEALTAKPGAIVAACLAAVAIAGNAALLRRQL